jgi:ATP-binding cassette subfamily B protein/subfamily B ATP-binding cassette protein MsbA
MGAVLGLMVASILFDLLKPWPLKLIVDNALKGQALPSGLQEWAQRLNANSPEAVLAYCAGATVVFFALAWLLKVTQAYLQTGIGTAMIYALAGDLFRHLQKLALAFHHQRQTGDLVRRVTADCTCIRDLIVSVALPALTSIVTLVGMALILCRLDLGLAAVSLGATPLLGFCIWHFARPMAERALLQSNAEGNTVGLANQVLGALVLVRVFGRETEETRLYENSVARANAAGLRTVSSQVQFKLVVGTITSIGTAAVLAVGGWHVLAGKLTLGELLIFVSYVQALYGPLETLAYLSSGWASAAARARRVFEVIDAEEMISEPRHPKALPNAHAQAAEIGFINVKFGYEPGRTILKNLSFVVRAGQRIALVGRSGAGKSALLSLLPRSFDPCSGRIEINGIDIREVSLSDLRAHISFVLQDDFILPLTIAENIGYGRPDATAEEIRAAAEAAHADQFIRSLPDGYQTVLGESGATLSGGERQRLSIARAFLKAAPLLILDEPSSALDSQSEHLVMQGLERLSAGRTVFVVAHRLSTIRGADRILVLEDGQITEANSYHELCACGGDYSLLPPSRTQATNAEKPLSQLFI